MDKWDELTSRIQQAILAEEPEAAVSAGFQVVCEFGRTLERIAIALEKAFEPGIQEAEEPAPIEHDL